MKKKPSGTYPGARSRTGSTGCLKKKAVLCFPSRRKALEHVCTSLAVMPPLRAAGTGFSFFICCGAGTSGFIATDTGALGGSSSFGGSRAGKLVSSVKLLPDVRLTGFANGLVQRRQSRVINVYDGTLLSDIDRSWRHIG